MRCYRQKTSQLLTFDLYKDGKEGSQQLFITAQLSAMLALDGECVCAPVFVQPGSTQPCLLGMNVIPHLGIKVTRANGEVMCSLPNSMPDSARVSLVTSVSIPSNRGCCVKAKVSRIGDSSDVLFEPRHDILDR